MVNLHDIIILYLSIQVALQQDSKIDIVRDSLAMNITMLSNMLAGQSQNGTAVLLSGINFFEGCATLVESNCTIQPAMPGSNPTPCITREVLLNQVSIGQNIMVVDHPSY